MNNEIDLLDELDRDERDERFATGGSGAGAVLGVVLTLLIGCGLVFAAYKLGQRKNVDEPPVIRAAEGPVKIAPENPGGSEIPNTDNLANAMIDGSRPALGDSAVEDGVIVEANLPDRRIDPAASLEAREIRREIVDLSDLAMKSTIEGEPELVGEDIPDRADERMMVSSADVTPNERPTAGVLAETGEPGTETAALDGAADGDPGLPGSFDSAALTPEVGPAETAGVDTVIATDPLGAPVIETANAFGEGVSVPMPMAKPNVGPSALSRSVEATPPRTPALAPETREPEQRIRRPLEPAIASRINPTPPRPPAPQIVQPAPQVPPPSGVRQVAIPPQPVGDAQVQLGAYPSPNEVRARWQALRNVHRDLLAPLGLQVLPVQTADGRPMFRMRVGPLRDGNRAYQLCEALRGRGVDCFVPVRR